MWHIFSYDQIKQISAFRTVPYFLLLFFTPLFFTLYMSNPPLSSFN